MRHLSHLNQSLPGESLAPLAAVRLPHSDDAAAALRDAGRSTVFASIRTKTLCAVDRAGTRQHIRSMARHLARSCHLPGMDADDIEQDLFLDLWRRRHAFDPSRATFATFANRIIVNRVATLTSPTARLKAERNHVWLDAPIGDDDAETLADTLADHAAPTELDHGLALDVRGFVAGLTPAQQLCCEILLSPKLGQAAAQAGLNRSSVYESAQRLRKIAVAAGLKEYVAAPRQIAEQAGM